MDRSRRTFLKIAGISALGLGAGTFVRGVSASVKESNTAPEFIKTPEALSARRWGLVIDTRKITPEIVEKMIETCHHLHNVPDHVAKSGDKRHEIKWIWETEYHNAFPTQESEFLAERLADLPIPVLCNHCDNPPCVRACPTQATFKREDGIVMMDFHRCIGCRFCMAACPFGSRSFNFVDPRPAIADENKEFPTRMKGVVEKCNFCAERLAVGKMPACVEVSEGALVFGDLDDPESEIRALLRENFAIRRKPGLGTSPSVFYIV